MREQADFVLKAGRPRFSLFRSSQPAVYEPADAWPTGIRDLSLLLHSKKKKKNFFSFLSLFLFFLTFFFSFGRETCRCTTGTKTRKKKRKQNHRVARNDGCATLDNACWAFRRRRMRFGANNAHRLRSHALLHQDKLSTTSGFSMAERAFRNAMPNASSIARKAFTGMRPFA